MAMGRPKSSSPKRMLQIRVDEPLLVYMQAESKARGKTLSEFARWLLARAVSQYQISKANMR